MILSAIVRFIRLALYSPKTEMRNRKEEEALADKRIVSRLSRGNIRLQRGQYVTRNQIEEQYERVKSLRFEEG